MVYMLKHNKPTNVLSSNGWPAIECQMPDGNQEKRIKNRCNHVWNWNIIDAVNGRAKQKEERSQYIDVACQNGDSKVNEEILCSFGYLFKNQCTSLVWIDLQ